MTCNRKETYFLRNKLLYILLNILFLFLLVPYLSPFPTASNIQPLAGLFSIFILLLLLSHNKRITFDKFDLFFLFIALISIVYINFDLFNFDFFHIKKRIGLFYAFFIYYIIKNYHHYFNFKIFKLIVLAYLLTSIFQTLFPHTMDIILSYLTNRQGSDHLTRGAQSLTTEPSFAGYCGIAFILILQYFKDREYVKVRDQIIIIISSILIIILSLSGTGFFIGLFFFMVYFFKNFNAKRFIIVMLITTMSIPIILYFMHNFSFRFLQILNVLLQSPELVFFKDPSIAIRIIQPYIGINSFIDAPFGHGAGSFSHISLFYFHDLKLDQLFTGYAYKRISYELNTPISIIGQYLIEIGFLFIAFILILLMQIKKSDNRIYYILFVIIGLLQAQPIVYTFSWLVIALNFKSNSKRKNYYAFTTHN